MKKISRQVSFIVLGMSFAVPIFAFAQSGINASYIQGYASSIVGIINGILVPVLISIAFVVFLWGIYKYFILGAASDTERASGRTFALYGIIGFVILFSLWGIVQIFMGTLGLTASNVPSFPTLPTNTGGNPSSGSNPISNLFSNQAQSQAASALTQASQAYNTCVAQSSASNCQSQANVLTQAQNAFLSTGGTPNSMPGWGVQCIGSGQSTCNPGLTCIGSICATNAAGAAGSGSSGCMDSSATNYNKNATTNDGSCTYAAAGDNACTVLYAEDSAACTAANGCKFDSANDCVSSNSAGNTTSSNATCAAIEREGTAADCNSTPGCQSVDGSCVSTDTNTNGVEGCMDSTASNYNRNATVNDGSCINSIPGCTDSTANNYDYSANFDNGSCTYNTADSQGNMGGCMDSSATNYDSAATFDNGSCSYSGGAGYQ